MVVVVGGGERLGWDGDEEWGRCLRLSAGFDGIGKGGIWLRHQYNFTFFVQIEVLALFSLYN